MWLKWIVCSIFSVLMALPLVSGAQSAGAGNSVGASASTNTRCKGCLCPGNPCQLCPLPPHTDDPVPENEPVTCRLIREAVPPAPFLPGENEYFPNLDKSTMVCIRSGGDVIRNTRRAEGYPARVYCKPDLSRR